MWGRWDAPWTHSLKPILQRSSTTWYSLCRTRWGATWHAGHGYCSCPSFFLISLSAPRLLMRICHLVHTSQHRTTWLNTGMWTVHLEQSCQTGQPVYQVVETHLLPIFGSDRVPEGFSHHNSLDSFDSFFVNHYVDHHAHEFLTG